MIIIMVKFYKVINTAVNEILKPTQTYLNLQHNTTAVTTAGCLLHTKLDLACNIPA